MIQNGSDLLTLLGGLDGVKNRLNNFEQEYDKTTNRSPQEVGMEIKNRIPPEQFQAFAAIADMVTGRRR